MKRMENQYIKSAVIYQGGKYKLLPSINPLFPDNINTFVDLFGGGFNVGVNVNADKVVYNDICTELVDLMRYFYNIDIDIILDKFISIIN